MPAEHIDWRDSAKCAGVPTDLFYPPRERYQPDADNAKAICRGKDGRPECPVRWACLWEAIDSDEEHGIWGGLSHRERNAAVRKWRKKYSHKISLHDYVKNGLR